MLDSNEPGQSIDHGAPADVKPACTALVPLVQMARPSKISSQLPRPNSIFVTHLIATIEQVPQTRSLCRASSLDANSAYQANQHLRDGRAGLRARQTI
jgi:hypothetical protein